MLGGHVVNRNECVPPLNSNGVGWTGVFISDKEADGTSGRPC